MRHMLQASGIPPRPMRRPSTMRTGLGKRGSQRARPTAKTKAAQTGSCRPRRMAKAKLIGAGNDRCEARGTIEVKLAGSA